MRQRELENEFYKDYRAYRENLYLALVEANPEFPGTKGRLVRLAQKILDRCIFIFYCEDMGQALGYPPQLLRDFLIEKSKDPYLEPDGTTIWQQLRALYHAMNDGSAFGGHKLNQFNGGLFASDAELDGLTVPNRLFCQQGQGQNEASLYSYKLTLLYLSASYNYAADLAKGLTTPPVAEAQTSPEERSATAAADARKADPDTALGLYTLGRVFEQSITELEILEAEAEGRVSVNKESKRKRDGVYYTPEWVVERIVKETLGARLDDFKRECGWPDSGDPDLGALDAYRARLEAIKVLDPACGSGAFLITALQFLLAEWAALFAVQRRVLEKQAAGRRFPDPDEDRLVRDLLRNNLYGVDINPASVEITQLALWLHTARGDRPLSSLGHHIRDGNSLVGKDFWKGQIDLALYDEEEKERVNTFDWEEAFPDVFETGGFDVVLGNPPYVKLQNFRKAHPDMAEFLRSGRPETGLRGYKSAASGNFDLYLPFIEKGLSLLRPGGRLGYIAPSLWTVNEYGEGLRKLVKDERTLDRWLDFRSHQIFDEATTYTALQFFRRPETDGDKAENVLVAAVPDGVVPTEPWESNDAALSYDNLEFGDRWLMLSGQERALIDRLYSRCTRLDNPANTDAIYQGLITSADPVYHLERIAPGRYLSVASGSRTAPAEVTVEDGIMHPLVSGPEAKRYIEPRTTTFLLFPYRRAEERMELIPADMMARDYPKAWAYLRSHQTSLRGRESGKMDDDAKWWGYVYPKNLDKQDISKLLVPRLVANLKAAVDAKGLFYLDNVDVGGVDPAEGHDPFFIAGVLNGAVANFVFRRISKPFRGDYLSANKQFIAPLPVPPTSDDERADIAARARALQRLHTERRDTLTDLRHRIEESPRRARRLDFLFPRIVSPKDREADAPAGGEAAAWAKARYEEEVAAEIQTIEDALHPDVTLEAVFERGELRLFADAAPIVDGMFLFDEEGPFIEAQWNAAADAFSVSGRNPAKKLTDSLRKLIVTNNDALIAQIIRLQTHARSLAGDIAAREAELNNLLYGLYGLNDVERELVERGS